MKKHRHISHHSTPRVSSPEISGLRESIEKIKLQKELKRLNEEDRQHESSEDKEERKTKQELEELSKKREDYVKSTKGFKGIVGRLSLNNQINQKKSYISNIQKLRNTNQIIKLKDAQTKAVSKENELRENRKKLNEIDIFGVNKKTKMLNFDDLFKT